MFSVLPHPTPLWFSIFLSEGIVRIYTFIPGLISSVVIGLNVKLSTRVMMSGTLTFSD